MSCKNLPEKQKSSAHNVFFVSLCDDNCLQLNGTVEKNCHRTVFACAVVDESPFLNFNCTLIALNRLKQMWNRQKRKKKMIIIRHVYKVCNGSRRVQGFTLWDSQCMIERQSETQ